MLFSCKKKQSAKRVKKSIQHELLIRDYVSQNFKSYEEEHKLVVDTIEQWVNLKLEKAYNFIFHKWQLDSLLLVNDAKNKLRGSILLNTENAKKSTQEVIVKVSGFKVNNQWRIILGSSTILIKELNRSFR